VLGTALLAPAARRIGAVAFDVNALAYACAAVLVGVQMVLLGGLAQLYARTEGLTRQRLPRWTRLLRLETAAAVGLALVAIGLVGSAAAVEHWGHLGFGALDPRGTIRLVLPSASLVALGVLWLFTGFVGSLLTLRGVRQQPLAAEPPPVPEAERLGPVR
jgi:cytochrome bd-type quinol oxidase subunit 2